jgi:threonine-phosphate decarboxylase
MGPDRTRTPDRAVHGPTADRRLHDFGTVVNPDRPRGVASAYDAALAAARQVPRDDYATFRVAVADRLDCEAAQVIPTAGRGDALRLVAGTLLSVGDTVLLPSPSLSIYTEAVRRAGAEPVYRPVSAVPDADPTAFDLVFTSTPNDPTGVLPDTERLLSLADRCREADTTLVVDETLLGLTTAETLAGTPGVVTVRDFTRSYGLAGLRTGAVVARGEIRRDLDRSRLPSMLSTPSVAVTTHCLGQSGFLTQSRDWLATERAFLRERLAESYDVRDAEAPFLFVDLGDRSVDSVVRTARTDGVALCDTRPFHGVENAIRVMVRRRDANEALLSALPDVTPP